MAFKVGGFYSWQLLKLAAFKVLKLASFKVGGS
jgi:hypothetical protein